MNALKATCRNEEEEARLAAGLPTYGKGRMAPCRRRLRMEL